MTPLDALYRAQRAWERTQPQLFMDLWPDDELEAGQTWGLPCFEPVRAYRLTAEASGGLNPGAEPCRAPQEELTAETPPCLPGSFAAPPASSAPPSGSGGSAPHRNHTGPGRALPHGTSDRGQRRPV